jgi:hypothetical protein
MAQKKRKVAELYEKIFRDDPLLLLADTQRQFGDEILRNLLIFRPQGTSSPHLIDVLSPSIKQAIAPGAAPDFRSLGLGGRACADNRRRRDLADDRRVARQGDEARAVRPITWRVRDADRALRARAHRASVSALRVTIPRARHKERLAGGTRSRVPPAAALC